MLWRFDSGTALAAVLHMLVEAPAMLTGSTNALKGAGFVVGAGLVIV